MNPVILDHAKVLADLDELAIASGGRFAGASRLAWTPEWLAARAWLTDKLATVGVHAKPDQAGNLWATVQGERDQALLVGSHIDSVPDGGWLDGALGSIAALEVVRQLAKGPTRPPLTIRFVNWADEEGARFGRSLFGSSACAGSLDTDALRDVRDTNGVLMSNALANCGVDISRVNEATASLHNAVANLELHIEQGPVLLDSARPAAAVAGTYGVERHFVDFIGQAAHAGPTPMAARRDSLAAASQALLDIRADAIKHGGTATAGRLESRPGVATVVAGWTRMHLDQRHFDPTVLSAMRDAMFACSRRAADKHDCTYEVRQIFSAAPTSFDPRLVEIACESVAAAGGGMGSAVASGALHDSTEIGRIVPTAMIFAQSDPAISHSRIEDSPAEALRIAVDAYGRAVEQVLTRAGELRLLT